jgi:hypothetical protein
MTEEARQAIAKSVQTEKSGADKISREEEK